MKEITNKKPESAGTRRKSNREVSAGFKSSLLKAEELCRIISTCARSNVASLKLGDLQVEFGTKPKPKAKEYVAPVDPTSADPDSSLTEAEISERTQAIDKGTLERDEIFLREQQIQELPLTNPLEFEAALASGDFEDDGSDPEA